MPAVTVIDEDYGAFVRRVRTLIGVDLSCYKPDQMRRRLLALAARHGAANLRGFADVMERDARAVAAFKDFFTINVSEFLRDLPRWHDLDRTILPDLSKGGVRPLRIWSAGCSIGAEPYSLAMLLEEMLPRRPYSVVATDIDDTILARARGGAGYPESDLRNVDAARRARFFTREANGTYAVKDELKRHVRFRRHDLLGPVPESDLDLIVCRNVVIYFTEETKRVLYQRFFDALRPGGMLFVGGTEVVMGAREVGLVPALTSFYRKDGGSRIAAA